MAHNAPLSPLAPKTTPDIPPLDGVRFAAGMAGVRYAGRTDVMLALMDEGATVAGVFTKSKCPSAPVDWCRAKLKGGKARVLGHAKAPAQGVGAQSIDGQRAQPVVAIFAALAAQQGGGIAGQDGAQRGQQAAVALGFGELAGQLGHQGQQGIQQRGRCSHGDIVSGQSDCN